MTSQYIKSLRPTFQPDRKIENEIFLININRMFYLSIISIFSRLISIITFLNKSSSISEIEFIWRRGIIISHSVYLVFIIIIALLTFKIKRGKKSDHKSFALQNIMVFVTLIFGVAITVIDQLVTPSITPLL